MRRGARVRLRLAVILVVIGFAAAPRAAHGVCSAIPAPNLEFVSTQGAVDRPFASPGDVIRVRCPCCSGVPDDRLKVTIAFDGRRDDGERDEVVLDEITVSGEGDKTILEFGFPDTAGAISVCADGRRCRFDDDCRTKCVEGKCPGGKACREGADCHAGPCLASPYVLSGPAMIAVADTLGAPVSCPTPTASPRPGRMCGDAGNLRACIDDFPESVTFPSFTALPPPNDYGALCDGKEDVCRATEQTLQLAVDGNGNLLVPVDWHRLVLGDVYEGLGNNRATLIDKIRDGLALGRQSIELPVARLVVFSASVPAFPNGSNEPIRLPESGHLTAYTPAGVRLPPVFEPRTGAHEPDAMVLFGTADAERSVLRIARGCDGGDEHCVIRTCDGGDYAGARCVSDRSECCRAGRVCADARCAAGLFDFRTRRVGGVGPVVIAKPDFKAEEDGGVSLNGLTQTDDLNVFVVHEALAREDLDDDGHLGSDVVVVQDRRSGKRLWQNAPSSGAPLRKAGRPVTSVWVPPFRSYALAAEGDVVAFLEPEADHDLDGDGDQLDNVLRVFRREGDELKSMAPPIAVDAAPVIDGHSLVVSGGRVFYRTFPSITPTTRQISSGPNGGGKGASDFAALSGDGCVVAFASAATNLVAADTNARPDVFVRDLCGGGPVTPLIPTDEPGYALGGDLPAISEDGRYVAYVTARTDSTERVSLYIRDRKKKTTTRVSTAAGGNPRQAPAVAADGDGFVVAFVSHPDGALLLYESERCAADGTQCISEISDGPSAGWLTISGDGGTVAYVANASCTNGESSCFQVFLYDRGCSKSPKDCTRMLTAAADGTPSPNEGFDGVRSPALSRDGRFVAFVHAGSTPEIHWVDRAAPGGGKPILVPSPPHATVVDLSADGRWFVIGSDLTAGRELWLVDRLTGLRTRVAAAAPRHYFARPALSDDGRLIAFEEPTSGRAWPDVFVRETTNEIGTATLHALDAATGDITTLCAATQVAVSDGRAVFLRPESAGSPACPRGDANGDGDELDDVAYLWEPTQETPSSLKAAARAVAFDGDFVAALVSETHQRRAPALDGSDPSGSLNDDADTTDDVVHVYSVSTKHWQNLAEAASRVDVSGEVVAYLYSEEQEESDYSGDSDAQDHTMRFAVVRPFTHLKFGGPEPARDFVLGPGRDSDGKPDPNPLVVFRAREQDFCKGNYLPGDVVASHVCVPSETPACAEPTTACDQNGDDDCCDDVLKAYRAPYGGLAIKGKSAVTTCPFATCDPQMPYRVGKRTVTFLSFTAENKPTDPPGDDLLVLQALDFQPYTPTLRVLGGVRAGRCTRGGVAIAGSACVTDADCDDGDSCRMQQGCLVVGTKKCDDDAQCLALDGTLSFPAGTTHCALPQGAQDLPENRRCLGYTHGCDNAKNCEHLIGAAGLMGDKVASATCVNLDQATRSIASALTAPLGGGVTFLTAGRCANDAGVACVVDSDCGNSDESRCLLQPTVATVGDTDADGGLDPLDTCPTIPNEDPEGTCEPESPCGDGVVDLATEICEPDRAATCIECARLCGSAPRGDCAPLGATGAAAASLSIDARNAKVTFGLRDARGTAPPLGKPLASTSYALCVYDGAGATRALLEWQALAGGSCDAASCWRQLGKRGFVFRFGAAPRGLQKLSVVAKPNGDTRIVAVGRAADGFPSPPFTTPVTVQVVNSETDACWQATFDAARRNDGTRFDATLRHDAP